MYNNMFMTHSGENSMSETSSVQILFIAFYLCQVISDELILYIKSIV